MKAILALLAAGQHLSSQGQDHAIAKDSHANGPSNASVQRPQMNSRIYHKPDSVDQQKALELMKLIRKLRWIGMEDEAAVVTRALTERFGTRDFSIGPPDTD